MQNDTFVPSDTSMKWKTVPYTSDSDSATRGHLKPQHCPLNVCKQLVTDEWSGFIIIMVVWRSLHTNSDRPVDLTSTGCSSAPSSIARAWTGEALLTVFATAIFETQNMCEVLLASAMFSSSERMRSKFISGLRAVSEERKCRYLWSHFNHFIHI